jgi:hypothetical protein
MGIPFLLPSAGVNKSIFYKSTNNLLNSSFFAKFVNLSGKLPPTAMEFTLLCLMRTETTSVGGILLLEFEIGESAF